MWEIYEVSICLSFMTLHDGHQHILQKRAHWYYLPNNNNRRQLKLEPSWTLWSLSFISSVTSSEQGDKLPIGISLCEPHSPTFISRTQYLHHQTWSSSNDFRLTMTPLNLCHLKLEMYLIWHEFEFSGYNNYPVK